MQCGAICEVARVAGQRQVCITFVLGVHNDSNPVSRFIGVTDRFLAELRPVSSGQVLKDMDLRYETLVRGLRHVQLKVRQPLHLIGTTLMDLQGLAARDVRRERRIP